MVTLVILDGFGINKKKYGNAIKLQGTPNLDKLKKQYPNTTLKASGSAVGLSEGQMGNSEVGHLNIGAGRVVLQELSRINYEIENGEFDKNEELNNAIDHCKKTLGKLHLMGLCSDGGVHSHINHLKALIDLAVKKNVAEICLHLFTDGRDTKTNSAINFINDIEEYIKGTPAKIKSICGRVYAMDRENRYDRIEKAYDMLCLGKADAFYQDAKSAILDSYEEKIYDEFIKPTIIGKPATIESGDSIVFFNFRTDRARELTKSIIEEFDQFDTKKLNDIYFVGFGEYDSSFKNLKVAFKSKKITDNLASIISENGLKQFHISETTKYAHVTFFVNGGIEKPYPGEDRKLIESDNVINFAEKPKMKAYEITEEVLLAITSKNYDFILVNLSNADMLGHTGDLNATKTAIESVDKCAYAIALATLMAGGDCIITADHGNAETMLDKNKNVVTSHTTNPVPFILCSQKYKKAKLKKDGVLGNIAPTILKLLNLNKPSTMIDDLLKK